jgi:hypothetical protein
MTDTSLPAVDELDATISSDSQPEALERPTFLGEYASFLNCPNYD